MPIMLLVLHLLTIGLSTYSCGWLLLKAERSAAAMALAACQLLMIFWCIPQLFLGFPMTKEMKYLTYGISYIGITWIGPAWLVFSFQYCGRRLSRRGQILLFGLAGVHYLVFLTNEYHHFFYLKFEVETVEYGWVFYVHMAYTYICVAGGIKVVLGEFKKKRVATIHLTVILLSAAVPLGFNILYLSGWVNTSFDLTPLAFALSSFLMLLAVLRYDFLDVNSLAFESVLSSIAEGVAIYNKRGTFVYCNQAATQWLGIKKDDSFCVLQRKLGSQQITVQMERELLSEESVFSLENGGKIRVKQYVRKEKNGNLAAGTFLLTNVGEYYERLRQSRELAVSAQRLAIEQERNRIAQEVHDTTGHTLTMIQSLLRLARVEWEKNRSVAEKGERKDSWDCMEEYFVQAQELAVEGIRELRISVNQLRQGSEGQLVTQGIFQLAKQVKELEVEVEIQGQDSPAYSHLSLVVYECFREAVTNCLKHAHASHMDVIVKFEEEWLRLYVFDDGQGCKQLTESNGIEGIRKRVERAGGQVRVLSSPGEGFQIFIGLPVGGVAEA